MQRRNNNIFSISNGNFVATFIRIHQKVNEQEHEAGVFNKVHINFTISIQCKLLVMFFLCVFETWKINLLKCEKLDAILICAVNNYIYHFKENFEWLLKREH